MPAYHSQFNDEKSDFKVLGNMYLLPIKTKVRGPAPQAEANKPDVIDEAIEAFRANVFFRNFEMAGNGDRVFVYLILFITDCLQVCTKATDKSDATKKLNTLALESFIVPGEKNFVLGGMYAPAGRDQETLRQYISQLRQELTLRLIDKVYPEGQPNKWWLCFAKKRFMNKSLADSNKA